jgi:hypothetical protein
MKVRAYGADAKVKACCETRYGVAPPAGYLLVNPIHLP